jgi:hypothetical protein
MRWVPRSLVAVGSTVLLAILGAVPGASGGVISSAGSQPRPHPTIHSSDGVRGSLLSTFPQHARLFGARLDEVGWQVAPGLDYSQWTEFAPQGPTRIFLLTAHWDEPGLVLDQVSGPTVTARAPLSDWLADDAAIAGVNADFFDINDTGAPLGVGVDRQRRTLHAPRSGWNTSFVIDSRGVPQVVKDVLVSRIVRSGKAAIGVSNFNSPSIPVGGIGDYTSAWGRAPGRRVVEGATAVREVKVRGGVVRYNRKSLSSGSVISGDLLVGRGAGAPALRSLAVGQRVQIQRALSVPAQVAVSGSVQLLHNGQPTTTDNGELHPRTAIGIDLDQRLLHLVVVDGRSENSGGDTLLQLAELLQSLGDEEALNLDGGGSSTMVARDQAGSVAVRNQPSDGHERSVANGLGFRYIPDQG